MARADRIIGSLLLLLAVAYYRLTYDIEVGLAADILGPAFFPRTLAILLGIASVALIVRGRWAKEAGGERPAVGDAESRLVWALVMTVVYLLLLPRAGYLVLTPIYLGAFAYLLGYRSWRPLVGTAIGVTVVLYFVFATMLRVRLPRGVLPG